MWEEGTLLINGKSLKYQVKHYDEPSEEYGIEGSRISKMEILLDGEVERLKYDRGWIKEPEDEETKTAFLFLMKKYG